MVTPRAKDDQWGLTPSLLDPTLLGFNLLGNHPGAPSSPASANTLYHRAAGDLHLANVAMNVLTPTCAPTSVQFDGASFQWGAAALPSGQVVGQSQVEQVHVDRRFSEADVLGQNIFATRDVLASIDPLGEPPLGNLTLDLGLAAGDTPVAAQPPPALHNEL